ncbi:lysophosphatidic acid receptor 6-like [Chiloscyllium plagiosum]|uniref:lysophosphatidic acid receptor 6-like n=1 Tax=Chiloscyllium plagiosum TaxID=36176 RepID=UPI001CB7CDDA|nr:lysophosphatidic acid receptor 6-like [Chiloscyllium plagiosum]
MAEPNFTCNPNDSFKYTLYSSVYSLVFLIGLVSNCVALYVLRCSLQLRNETITYMTNLAVSDLLFVFTLPFRIFYYVTRDWPFGDLLCKVSGTLFLTNMYGSILFLTCISVDRFLAIVHPFRSRMLRSKRNAIIVCVAVWVTVLTGSVPATFLQTTNNTANQTKTCFENFSSQAWKHFLSKIVIFIEIVGFFIPLLLNIFCFSMVLKTLKQPITLCRSKLNKKKVLRMIVVHFLIFITCFVPYNVTLVMYSLVRTGTVGNCSVVTVVKAMYPITLCFAVSNCCFDPIVYYFTSETFKNSIKRKSKSLRLDSDFEASHSTNFLNSTVRTLKSKMLNSESTV